MDVMGALSAVSGALEAAKALRDVEKAWDQATYRQQIADLVEKLTDAKLMLG